MRTTTFGILAALILPALVATAGRAADSAAPPNIIFILADDK
jgi:hypothetical protein